MLPILLLFSGCDWFKDNSEKRYSKELINQQQIKETEFDFDKIGFPNEDDDGILNCTIDNRSQDCFMMVDGKFIHWAEIENGSSQEYRNPIVAKKE